MFSKKHLTLLLWPYKSFKSFKFHASNFFFVLMTFNYWKFVE